MLVCGTSDASRQGLKVGCPAYSGALSACHGDLIDSRIPEFSLHMFCCSRLRYGRAQNSMFRTISQVSQEGRLPFR